MSRPLALDLFCCSGGSTTGLERAGFDVIGVDWKPSPHWTGTGELHEADLSTADAIESVIRAFAPDFVSASPPCQAFSMATPTRNRGDHPNLIPAAREGIARSGVPGWIENVHGAPLHHAIRLCGAMFPETQRLRRHRFFELIGWWTFEPTHANCTFEPVQLTGHGAPGRIYKAERERRATVAVAGHGPPDAVQSNLYRERRHAITMAGNGGHGPGQSPGQSPGQNNTGPECIRWREALGWLDGPKDRYSLAQAVPPAYAEFLGRRFLERRLAPTA